jgi:NADH-quinone oxidoreductase subunit J
LTAQAVVFYLFAFIAVFSAVMVVSRDNPVHSALWLILNLISIAVLYYTLNAPFLMVAQLIVYAGAIVVLFVFVVMMLSSTRDERARPSRVISWVGTLGIALAFLFFLAVFLAIRTAPDTALMGAPVEGAPLEVGKLMFRKFLLPFEATSILLLAALVGAMYLGRHGDKGEEDEFGLVDGEPQQITAGERAEAESREEVHV